MINILQKKVQGDNALLQPTLDHFPLGAWNNTRQEVMRKNAFRTFAPAINGKRNALIKKRLVRFLFAAPQLFRRLIQQTRIKLAIVASRASGSAKHLVISRCQSI